MKSHTNCQNCHSPRRPIKARGLCAVCFTWQRRIDRHVARVERAKSDPGKYYLKYDASSLPLRIDKAKRVLEEFRWREEGLLTDSTDYARLEDLVRILADSCRPELDVSTYRLMERMSPQSRRLMYEVLLAVVENIPKLDPILHDGWGRWFQDRTFSPEGEEQRRAGRSLQKAYWDSVRQGDAPVQNQHGRTADSLLRQALAPKKSPS